MRLTAALLAVVSAVALVVGCGGSRRVGSDGRRADGVPAAASASLVRARRLRAVFRSRRGDAFRVYEARRADAPGTCVVSAGRGFASVACAAHLFARSRALFVESGSGGPGGSPRSDFEVSGLVADDVARAVVAGEGGRTWPVQLADGAFFFELPRGEVGVRVESLVLYDAGGTLLESVPL